MRRVIVLFLAASAILVSMAALANEGLALLTDQASVPGNTFSVAGTAGCVAGNSGWLGASAQIVQGGGDGFEVTPGNAFIDGGLDPNYRAQNINGPNDQHTFHDYNLALPSGCSTIAGIEVRLDWWLDSTVNRSRMRVQLSWDGGATWTGPLEDAVQTTSEHTAILGGPANTWGRPWSTAELGNAVFRVRVRAQSSGNGHLNRDFFLDWVPVRIYYAP